MQEVIAGMLSPPAFSFPTKVLLLAEMNRKIKSMKERENVMITIQGLYNTAVCYTPELEEAARKQIQTVCDQAEFAGCKIRIMPDVHAGKGCTIGTTMTIQDKIVPGMVGVDIGCGMETVELREREVDFEKLDALIRREIPYGREVRDIPHALNAEIDLTHLRCTDQVNLNRAMRSIGSLGGGNHFIEVDRAEDGRLFLVVHSGSRHLGTEVAEHYQNEGRRALWGGPVSSSSRH
jgi:tRNA-splicing ligase RtcB